jgi:hypothetical protein
MSGQRACALCQHMQTLTEALRWALDYGRFDVAEDNPLHAGMLDRARAAIAKAEPARLSAEPGPQESK